MTSRPRTCCCCEADTAVAADARSSCSSRACSSLRERSVASIPCVSPSFVRSCATCRNAQRGSAQEAKWTAINHSIKSKGS